MTTMGFFSIVKRDDLWVIRAREERDIRNLVRAMTDGKRCKNSEIGLIHETPVNDYRWRIYVTERGLQAIFAELAETIDYSNFKSHIAGNLDQGHKLAAYHEVWDVMARHLGAYGMGPFVDRRPFYEIQSADGSFDLSRTEDDEDGAADRGRRPGITERRNRRGQ